MHKAVMSGLLLVLACLPAQAGRFKASKATGTELLTCLDEQGPGTQRDCMDEIADRRLVQASPQIAELVRVSPDEDVRRTGLIVLERLGAPEMLSVAQQSLLTDPVSANRQKSLRLVELYGGQDSQEVLGQVIAEDQDADIRRKAIIIAGKKQWKGIEPILVDKGLKDPDPDVVLEAARAIVRMGNPDSRPFIHDLMVHSPHSRTREWVVRAVEEAPMALDRDPLIQCLDDPDPDAARHAARALRNLGDPSVAPILREKAMAAREPAIAEEFSAAALHLEVLGQGGDDGI